jgi:hypothetical protein
MSLSASEEMVLAYISGYFFGKLLKYHKGACISCSSYGEKITSSTTCFKENKLFIYFKQYKMNSATLYTCSDHLVSFVCAILQITNYCYAKCIESPQFVSLVTNSVLTHLMQWPELCTSRMTERFVRLVARTMLVYKLKWLNSELKTRKKSSKKKSAKEKKFDKLTHM